MNIFSSIQASFNFFFKSANTLFTKFKVYYWKDISHAISLYPVITLGFVKQIFCPSLDKLHFNDSPH